MFVYWNARVHVSVVLWENVFYLYGIGLWCLCMCVCVCVWVCACMRVRVSAAKKSQEVVWMCVLVCECVCLRVRVCVRVRVRVRLHMSAAFWSYNQNRFQHVCFHRTSSHLRPPKLFPFRFSVTQMCTAFYVLANICWLHEWPGLCCEKPCKGLWGSHLQKSPTKTGLFYKTALGV